jgi:hypothetical protein
MKALFTILLLCTCGVSWCQSDSTGLEAPQMVHISAFGTIDSVFLNNNFTILSLVSPATFEKWNPDELRSKYGKRSVLIVVARHDSAAKTKFVTCFFQNLVSSGSKQRAYERAIEEVGPNAEIKHILILNE